jgi:carboxypeptidase PM20D1
MPSLDAKPDADAVVAALSALVRHATVAGSTPDATDPAPFDAVHDELRRAFPLLHERCAVERIAGNALLIRWPGRTADAPLVLMGHLDVVGAGDPAAWTHPPFDPAIADGHLWGRGTLDCKGPVVAICAAVEALIADGVQPARDVWLSFGCDEETSGPAASIAADILAARGVTPWFILDEGGAIVSEAFPKVEVPLALIGVGEKGFLDLDLRATGAGGHSSMPPAKGATARLARAIVRLEGHPFASHMTDAVASLFTTLAAHVPAPLSTILARTPHLRRPLALLLPHLGGEAAALVRTTVAVTRLKASDTRNALAPVATASVNLRIMPGETVDGTVRRVRRVVADPAVEVIVVGSSEPTPMSGIDDPAFALLADVTRATIPDAVPVPYLVLGTTDARHFHRRWPRVYRFSPLRYSPALRQSLHNADERVPVASLLEAVAWYRALLMRL